MAGRVLLMLMIGAALTACSKQDEPTVIDLDATVADCPAAKPLKNCRHNDGEAELQCVCQNREEFLASRREACAENRTSEERAVCTDHQNAGFDQMTKAQGAAR